MRNIIKKSGILCFVLLCSLILSCGGGGGGSDDPNTEKESVIGETGTEIGSVDMDGDGVSDGTAIDVDGDGTPDGVDTDGDGKIDEEYSEDYTLLDEAMTDAEAVAEDKANLAVGYSGSDSSDSVTQNITLAANGSNGTTITWTSSDTTVIAADGTVTRPTYGSGDATVTLTATITKNGVSETKTFTITVKEVTPSTNAALASLAFTKGMLQPVFSAGTTNYLNAPVPFSSEASPAYNDTQSVTVTATTANSGATITVNGTSVTSGSAFTINNLDVGKNNATVVVTAQDGVTKTTYTVEVYRAIPVFKTGAAELTGYTFVAGEDGHYDTHNPALHV
ncbi:MAG: cadherin-like beta sandwich domain-containing protein, partial [Spirochaetes bacterium]|nr:cadherin-like beta sandwich domain-containing protein [Spirochaetota bacterium]